MCAAVYKIYSVKNKTTAETAPDCRRTVKLVVAEICIFVGIARRPESEGTDNHRVGILGYNGYAESRILLYAIKSIVLFIEAYCQRRILTCHLKFLFRRVSQNANKIT